jgi:hypothetical protein
MCFDIGGVGRKRPGRALRLYEPITLGGIKPLTCGHRLLQNAETGKQPGAQLGDPPSFDPSIYNDCLTILPR